MEDNIKIIRANFDTKQIPGNCVPVYHAKVDQESGRLNVEIVPTRYSPKDDAYKPIDKRPPFTYHTDCFDVPMLYDTAGFSFTLDGAICLLRQSVSSSIESDNSFELLRLLLQPPVMQKIILY